MTILLAAYSVLWVLFYMVLTFITVTTVLGLLGRRPMYALSYDGHFTIEQGFTTTRLSEFKLKHHKRGQTPCYSQSHSH